MIPFEPRIFSGFGFIVDEMNFMIPNMPETIPITIKARSAQATSAASGMGTVETTAIDELVKRYRFISVYGGTPFLRPS